MFLFYQERFKKLCEAYIESHTEGLTQRVVNLLWAEAAGGEKRGGVFGKGSMHSSVRKFRNPAAGGTSPLSGGNSFTNTQMAELRRSIEEELTKKMEEKINQQVLEKVARFQQEYHMQQAYGQSQRHYEQSQRTGIFHAPPYAPSAAVDTSYVSLLNSNMFQSASRPPGVPSSYAGGVPSSFDGGVPSYAGGVPSFAGGVPSSFAGGVPSASQPMFTQQTHPPLIFAGLGGTSVAGRSINPFGSQPMFTHEMQPHNESSNATTEGGTSARGDSGSGHGSLMGSGSSSGDRLSAGGGMSGGK